VITEKKQKNFIRFYKTSILFSFLISFVVVQGLALKITEITARRVREPQKIYILPFHGNGIVVYEKQLKEANVSIEEVENCIKTGTIIFHYGGEEIWTFKDSNLEIDVEINRKDVDGNIWEHWAGVVVKILKRKIGN